MRNFFISILFLLMISLNLTAQPTIMTVGNGGTEYLNLYEAFEDINNGNIKGDIILQIIDNCTQTLSAILYPTGYLGNSDYSSITIYPTGSGYVISGDIDGPLIELNGAANVTFDGRVDQAGAADLVITNTSTGTSASTIKFTESANTNTIHYCIIKGAETGDSSGIIFFSTASAGAGNDGNTIEYNNITGDAAGRPVNALFSSGTSGRENSGNNITNNNFFDFLNHGIASNGIFLSDNTISFTVTGNSFYETASFTPTGSVEYNLVLINNTGTGFNISNNYFGGQAASSGGPAWTKTVEFDNIFTAINISVGTGTATSVQNNNIRNFSWSNSLNAKWTAIRIAGGDVNVGTVTGNITGSSTGTGSIVVTGSTSGVNVYGIDISGGGIVNCQNNTIGSVTTANADANASNFYGINASGSGAITISTNTIGSITQSNSINASSGSTGANAQIVMGINNSGTGTILITNNTIDHLTNSTTNTGITRRGLINGISSTEGTVTISGNIIRNLTIANGNNTPTFQASICGIALTGITYPKTVTGNTIYNLLNTYATFAGSIIGIFHTGTTASSNAISENFIHSFTVSSSSASFYGIKINSGVSTYSNNIIFLTASTATTIYGIYESGPAGNNNNLYFNSIYISGSPASGTRNSYALFSAVTTNTRDFRNNVLHNARSNSGATGTHYALYIASAGGSITSDYNDYYVSGTGGVLGFYAGNKASLPIVTGQDVNSLAIDPVYTIAGSTTASDYTIGADLIGVGGTGITTDFGSAIRNNPTMGAWERIVNKWKGNISTAWNLAGNWTETAVPLENSNIIFDDSPVNDLYLNTAHSVNNVTNGSAKFLVTNGYQLTLNGNLTFTGGAQIDATASSSTLVYAGTSAQTISGTNFVSGKTFNLTIDNAAGVTINSDFTVDNNLTINSGMSLTVSAGIQLSVSGTLTNSAGNSGLIIRSDANGNDGKLINNTTSVPATVELFLSGGAGTNGPTFHYFTPPVQTMSFDNSSIPATAADLGMTNFNGDLMLYDETKAIASREAGWQYFDGFGGTTGFSSLISSKGYNIYLTGNDRITFNGQLNGPAHSFNLSYTGTNPSPGWNLVGNPYPCNYDINGVAALTTDDDGVDNTIYFNHDGGYAYWNVITGGTTGYSDILPPMQGFFVHVTETGKSLSLPTAYKSSSAAVPLRSKGNNDSYDKGSLTVSKIKLVLSTGQVKDETIVCLINNATSGFDGNYDAYKLFSSSSASPSIFSNLNSLKYAINAVREAGTEDPVRIPVSVIIKNPGTYKIDITEFENLEGMDVVLRHGALETVLSKDVNYTFTSGAGTFNDFELIFGNTGNTTAIEPVATETIKTWYSNKFLYIRCPQDILSNKGNLNIYNLEGKIVYSENPLSIEPGQTIQFPLNLVDGIYVTHIYVNNQSFVSKIVVY